MPPSLRAGFIIAMSICVSPLVIYLGYFQPQSYKIIATKFSNHPSENCHEHLFDENVVEHTELPSLGYKMLTLANYLELDRPYMRKIDLAICPYRFTYFLPKLHKDELLTLLELFRFFIHVAKKSNTTYYLCGGSLIGLVRHNKRLIPWDDDIDIVISKEHLETFESTLKEEVEIFKNSSKKNFQLIEPKFNHFQTQVYKLYDLYQYTTKESKYNFPHIDIFLYTKFIFNNKAYVDDAAGSPFQRTLNESALFPLKKDVFLGQDVYIPADVANYLYDTPTYMTACVSRQYAHRYNKDFIGEEITQEMPCNKVCRFFQC